MKKNSLHTYFPGKKYDKNGNMTNWFTEEMTARFRERAICFVEQYAQFPLEMVGKNVRK